MIEKIKEIGYTGEDNLSLIIDWIRNTHKFYIWIEHGTRKKDGSVTHDVTISGGCMRGSHNKYESAQIEGISLFIKHYEKIHS